MNSSRLLKIAILTKWTADRQQRLPTGIHIADGYKTLAGGLWPWPVMCGDASHCMLFPSKS